MKLSIHKIQEIATGCSWAEETNKGILLHRFTKEQEVLYKGVNEEFYQKTLFAAGITLSFKTDSKSLFIKITTQQAASRQFFSVDLFVDGVFADALDNFSDTVLPEIYSRAEFPLGEFSKTFSLGDGEKTVCVHMPFSTITTISELSLDDGAYVEAVKPAKKLLAFGDSITHGYDALRPSNRYIGKLAKKLGAEEFNKGIAADTFFPALAETKDDFLPDYITVAYGTNDWHGVGESTFVKNCGAFYRALSRNYPQAKIFAITPLWRKDEEDVREFGEFKKVERLIFEAVEDLPNVTAISGYHFIPHDEIYFADRRLHPNDAGFDLYYKNLYDKIKAYI